MKQQKTINLENAYEALKAGEEIRVMNAENTCAVGTIWGYRSLRNGKYYFGWQHGGASANKATLRDLRWIFKSIMNRPDYDFEVVG